MSHTASTCQDRGRQGRAERREDLSLVLKHCLYQDRSGTPKWQDCTVGEVI